MINFSNMTKEQLENVTKEELNKLTEEEFLAYYEASKNVGNVYLYDGLPESETKVSELNPSYKQSKFYGNFNKILKNVDGKWQTWQGAGLVPTFTEKPLAVDEPKFISLMEALGISADELRAYFEYKVDYNNF